MHGLVVARRDRGTRKKPEVHLPCLPLGVVVFIGGPAFGKGEPPSVLRGAPSAPGAPPPLRSVDGSPVQRQLYWFPGMQLAPGVAMAAGGLEAKSGKGVLEGTAPPMRAAVS